MPALSVAVVHGINTDVMGLATLGADVQALVDGIVHGVPVAYANVRWESSGTIAGDVWAMRSRRWLLQQMAQVKQQLFRARPDIVVAHSLGSALAHAAVTETGMRCPVICLGSPMGHPLIGRYLSMAGLMRPVPKGRVRIDLWNRDDAVTTLAGRWHRELPGWKSVRVAVAGDLGLVEHSHRRYIFADGRRVPLHGATVRAISPLLYAAAGIEVQ